MQHYLWIFTLSKYGIRRYYLETLASSLVTQLLLLPVYWYALNYEDYHQWSARREMVVEERRR